MKPGIFKKILVFIFVVACSQAISVFSGHIFTIFTDPRALKDGQYPLAFMFWSGAGLFIGILLFVLLKGMAKRKPSFQRSGLIAMLIYCLLFIASSIIIEKNLITGIANSISLFLIGFLPFLFVISLFGFFGLIFHPLYLSIILAVFAPLIMVFILLYRLSPRTERKDGNKDHT